METVRGARHQKVAFLCLALAIASFATSSAWALGAPEPGLESRTQRSLSPVCGGALEVQFVGNTTLVTMGSWTFLDTTIYDSCGGTGSIVVFAVWKPAPGGATIAVETAGAFVIQGQTASFYDPVFNVPAGTYLVSVFAITTSNAPLSTLSSVEISIG